MKAALLPLLLILALPLSAAEDPYALWSNGQPERAQSGLFERASASGRWDAWLDAGLAAAAANDRGHAAAWLLEALRRAPERPEPRRALSALGCALPAAWLDRVGPLALPGTGWVGVGMLALSGFAFGLAFLTRGRRSMFCTIGALALVAALPGQIALYLDGRRELIAVVTDTHLLDNSGSPRQSLAAGTVVIKEPHAPWSNRYLVSLLDGTRGFVPLTDCAASPR
jgi:hypothetical protein